MQVVHLGITLRKLQLSLGQRDALGHREYVWITNRNYIDAVIEVLCFDHTVTALYIVRILRW